ncbi:uncharacterized protein LOC115793852 [Archocentrus centrarchus]|uniref:uncharacterized protein LOC115793852 n=1 Tax=Archocentrus centrarchus TaxID=63155 RepID=UPI0011EA3BF9|nr:uncharacterized protein LOC115793852 [Archocentrus centrarchus]
MCKQGLKLWLHKHGHILSAFEFQKAWDYQTIVQHIKDGFGERIPEDVSLDFLMACGSKLVSPKLQDGQELNGMLIPKVFKNKALYVRQSRTLLSDSEEDNELSHIGSRSALSRCTTTRGSDDDCFDVGGPQIQAGMSTQATSRVTTRFSSHAKGDNPGTSSDDEDGTGTNRIARSSGKRLRAKTVSDGSSICDKDYMARSEGNPGTRGHSEGFMARSGDVPVMSANDEDYSSYLTLVASLSGESSGDEDLNQAIIASLESHIGRRTFQITGDTGLCNRSNCGATYWLFDSTIH